MIPYFPNKIGSKGILLYFLSLVCVTFLFFSHAMPFVFMLLGATWIIGFFSLSASCSKSWARIRPNKFESKLFWSALCIRLIWVIFSYYFYSAMTGIPFEFDAADSKGYHELAEWWSEMPWGQLFSYITISGGVSDLGYPFFLSLLYKLVGPSIIIARLIKSILGAFTCVLTYRLASRNIGEQPGRIAGIFTAFMPNLVIYCGLHCKEIEMLTLIVAFLERSDYMIRNKKISVKSFSLPLLFAFCLFFFRTVLGVIAIISLCIGLLFSAKKSSGRFRTVLIVLVSLAFASSIIGGAIVTEVEENWDGRVVNATLKREHQARDNGVKWAKYATGTVMAPAVFIMPLSTMVDTDQNNQLVMHGGNYVRNFLGVFVLIALFTIVTMKKEWQKLSLIISFEIGYLGVIAFSGYGNAERFLLPATPVLLILAAYGISGLNARNYKFVKYWYVLVVVMEVAWAYFKIGSRGLF